MSYSTTELLVLNMLGWSSVTIWWEIKSSVLTFVILLLCLLHLCVWVSVKCWWIEANCICRHVAGSQTVEFLELHDGSMLLTCFFCSRKRWRAVLTTEQLFCLQHDETAWLAALRLSGCWILLLFILYCCFLQGPECQCDPWRIFLDICVLIFFLFTWCRALCLWCVSGCFCFLLKPHFESFPSFTQVIPPCFASYFELSFPLLSSYVDEIRWFLLGEASVHPSAAPTCTCPTPNTQVIT